MLVGIVCCSGISLAGTVELAWDYPLDWQPGTTYLLHIITVRNGAPIAADRVVVPFSAQQCQRWSDPMDMEETLCGEVCLEPGDYSLSLRAQHAGALSDSSNILDL